MDLPHFRMASTSCSRSGGADLTDKRLTKNLWSLVPRNPLISLDSDERIQGNPRKSNPLNRGFQSETATDQENPNGASGPASRGRRREGAKPTPSEGRAP
jgi:hypothetical protein